MTSEKRSNQEGPATCGHLLQVDRGIPTKTKPAKVVAKKLLDDILSRYGFPHMIGSDNRLAFVSKVSQDVAKVTVADWELHCAY